MSATVMFPCGCSITNEMDEKRTLVSVDFCRKHIRENPEVLRLLADEMNRIQSEEGKKDRA